MTLKGVGQMPALMALVALKVLLNVAAGWAKNGFVLLQCRLVAGGGVSAATGTSGVTSMQIRCASSITFGRA